MTFAAARLGLAASAAVAVIAVAAVLPAAAQTQTYPQGTDCTKLVGNSKMECERASKNTGAPDNSNNPDAGGTMMNNSTTPSTGTGMGTGTNSMPSSTAYPPGTDCTKLVGNSKEECEHNSKNSPSPDNANNPDQTN